MNNKTICMRRIYDDTISMINFDKKGVCNYFRQYDSMCEQYPINECRTAELEKIVEKMKCDGKGKPYDVVIGGNGGCRVQNVLIRGRKMLAEKIQVMCLEFISRYDHYLKNTKKQSGKATYYCEGTPDDSELDITQSLSEQINLLRVVDNDKDPSLFVKNGKKYIIKIHSDTDN